MLFSFKLYSQRKNQTTEMNLRTVAVYISALLAMLFWALSFIWYKEVFVFYKPITLVFLRLIVSSIFLFIVTASVKRLNKIQKEDYKYFLLLAFFEPFMYFIGESFGVSLIPSTLAAVIVATIPLFSPIGAYYFFRERISWMNFAGIIVSIVGVGMVIFHNGFNLNGTNPLGVALMFLAVASAIGYSIVIKRLSDKYNTFSMVTYQNTIGIFLFLPLFLIFEFKHFMSVPITADVVIPILKLGIFASTFAFIFFTFAIKNLGITKANIFTNAIPVLTALFAYYLLGEVLTPIKMLGIAIVISGLLLSQVRRGMFKSAVTK